MKPDPHARPAPAKSLREEKAALRRRILKARAAMSAEERARASAAMLEHLRRLSVFREARGVHCFLSMGDEIDTAPLFALCREEGRETFVPFVDGAAGRLGWARWKPGDALQRGPLGVAEPPPAARIPGSAEASAVPGAGTGGGALPGFGLVLVPGLAFDERGGRLGYGKGYYDEFLARTARLRGTARRPLRIGLGFALQMVEAVPMGPGDERLDWLVSEAGALEIRPAGDPAEK